MHSYLPISWYCFSSSKKWHMHTHYAYRPELKASKWMDTVKCNNNKYLALPYSYSSNWGSIFFASIDFSQYPKNNKLNDSIIYIKNNLFAIRSFLSYLDVHSTLFSFILWLFFGLPAMSVQLSVAIWLAPNWQAYS